MKKGLIISLLLPLIFACGDIENCGTDQNLEFMFVRFFDKETKQAKKVGFEVFSSDPFVQFLLPAVTKIEDGDTTIVREAEVLGLPLNTESSTISYFFNSDTSSHELVVSYDREVSIFDPDCEPSLTFINLDTVRQTFDSTVVVSRITNIFITTNIEIYF